MTKPVYDPAKAHDYYEKHKHLQGRQPGAAQATLNRVGATRIAPKVTRKPASAAEVKSRAQARVVRLTAKIHSLTKALKEAQDALRAKRQEAKKNSDGKTTAKEKAASQKYRDTHKAQIATKAKQDAAKSGGSKTTSSTPSGPKSVSDMSESELTDRISKIQGAIGDAKKQIQSASALAHSFSSSEFISHSGPTTVTTN